MPGRLSAFIEDESGATMIEYALIAGLIAMLLVGTLHTSGGILRDWFYAVSGEIINAMPGG